MRTLSAPPTDLDHVLGSLDAPLVIVEYGDYDCPHTRRAHANLKQLLAEAPAERALVFRHFPLRHLHQNAQQLSTWMQAIESPSLYWQAHQRLMALRHMSLETATEQLAELGIEPDMLASRHASAEVSVQEDVERGLADGVHSTPSFFFNGAPHDGHYDIDTLKQQLAAAPERLR
jgi:protein-disulfide isomerase